MYDVVVVGASISGLYAGCRLAERGLRVIILDRREHVGVPVRCGEATGNRAELSRFMPVDESWVAAELTGLAVHVGTDAALSRRIPDTGLILHRDRFEQSLAERARSAGAEIRLCCPVTGLVGEPGAWRGVTLADGTTIEASLIAGADGAESSIGRWAGLLDALPLEESYSAAQYRVQTDFCADGHMHFFVGQEVIPRGYVWVFPKSDGEVSVGAGLYGGRQAGKTALDYLELFLNTHAPDAPRRMLISGCAPMAVCPRHLHDSGLVLVGDAARQVNPLTAGGIMNALEAVGVLLSVLDPWPSDSTGLKRCLARYSRRQASRPRREQKVFSLLRMVYLDCDDHTVRNLLTRGERVLAGMTDRSQTFRFPLVSLARILVILLPRAWRHFGVLFG